MHKLGFVVALATLASSTAWAGAHEKREACQDARIARGVASGELTKRETRRLVQQQARVNMLELKARADGKVTKAEHVRIHQAQNRASANVFRKKHNRRDR